MITLLLSGYGTPVTTLMIVSLCILAGAMIVVRIIEVSRAARWADVAAQRRERWEAWMTEQDRGDERHARRPVVPLPRAGPGRPGSPL
jgi:hypothetical protein